MKTRGALPELRELREKLRSLECSVEDEIMTETGLKDDNEEKGPAA